MKDKYIYHITLDDGKHYIGKKADKNIYQYHLRRAAPKFMNWKSSVKTDSSAWEGDWQKQISAHGLANTSFIKIINYDNYQLIQQQLKNCLAWTIHSSSWKEKINSDTLTITEDLWNLMIDIWKPRSKKGYEITEALAIMMGYNEFGALANTQIDFMAHDVFNKDRTWFDRTETNRKLAQKVNNLNQWFVTINGKNISLANNPQAAAELYPTVSQVMIDKLDKEIHNKIQYYFNNDKNLLNTILVEWEKFKKNNTSGEEISKQLKKINTQLQKLEINYNKKLNEFTNKMQGNIGYSFFQIIINSFFQQWKFSQLTFNQYQSDRMILDKIYKTQFSKQMLQTIFPDNSSNKKTRERLSQERLKNMKDKTVFIDTYARNIFREQLEIRSERMSINDMKYY